MGKFENFVLSTKNFATAVGTDIKALGTSVAGIIKDSATNLTSTWSSSKINTMLNGKVDKVAGKVLSDNNYTNAEKTKLAGLESSKWLGNFTTKAALETAHPNASEGNYADVDEVGKDVVRYIWDVTESKWVAGGVGTALTAAQVYQLYGANPLAEHFQTADKDKLDGIQAGAEKNNFESINGQSAGVVVIDKASLGLDKVKNYPLATQAQAEAQTSNAVYMTPLRTKEEVDAMTGIADPLAAYNTAKA